MSPELDKQLCEKYPKIFVNRNASPQESCMCWGLEIGDGWYNLIDLLCEAVTYTYTSAVEIDEEDAKRLGIEGYVFTTKGETQKQYFFNVKAPQVIADQVKEKFGTLRFYYHLEYDTQNLELVKSGKYPKLAEANHRYANYIDGIVHFADIASAYFCEVSGAKGELHKRGGEGGRGWFKTLSKEVVEQEETLKGYKTTITEVKKDIIP